MAAGSMTLYDAAKLNISSGLVNLSTGNFNMVLVAAAYTPSITGDSTYANISGNEVTGTGYTAGGVTLASQSLSYEVSSTTLPVIVAGGSGFAASSSFNLTVSGGTSTTAAVVNVTTNGSGVVTTVNSVGTQGVYSALPTNPAATTGGSGTGATLTLTWGVAYNSNPASWANSTITAKYAAIVGRAGGSLTGTDKLLAFGDLNVGGGAISSTNATFQVSPSAVGWFVFE